MGQFLMCCAALVMLGDGRAAGQFLLLGAFAALFTPWPWAILAAVTLTKEKP